MVLRNVIGHMADLFRGSGGRGPVPLPPEWRHARLRGALFRRGWV